MTQKNYVKINISRLSVLIKEDLINLYKDVFAKLNQEMTDQELKDIKPDFLKISQLTSSLPMLKIQDGKPRELEDKEGA